MEENEEKTAKLSKVKKPGRLMNKSLIEFSSFKTPEWRENSIIKLIIQSHKTILEDW